MINCGCIDIVPDAAQEDHAKVENHLRALVCPAHTGELQSLCKDRFAGGLGNSAADREL